MHSIYNLLYDRSGQLLCGELVKYTLLSHQYGGVKSLETIISGKNARLTAQTHIHSSVEDWILIPYFDGLTIAIGYVHATTQTANLSSSPFCLFLSITT